MKITRRKLLIGGGVIGGGLLLGISIGGRSPVPVTAPGSFQPNAWLQITNDGKVLFQMDKAEMGQGVYSTLTTIMGEALDYDPRNIVVEMAPPHSAYNNPAIGMQLTGGSTSVTASWLPLSEAGATARAMLLAAAAQQWEVPLAELTTDDGVIIHAQTDKRANYGDFAEAAKSITPPESVAAKAEADYKWIGKSLTRLDTPAKSNGTAIFGVDVVLPNMKTAVLIRCPHFGGTLKSFDASAAQQTPGVQKVFAIHNGVAVVADGYWQARQAAAKINVEWDKGPLAGLSSEKILAEQHVAMDSAETIVEATNEGDADTLWDLYQQESQKESQQLSQQQPQQESQQQPQQLSQQQSGKTLIEATYSAPFLHHSTMEPQNCTALVTGDECEIWAPSQAPGFVQALAAQFGGFAKEKVTVHTTMMGGGFGRRAMTDFAGEVAAIAKQMPGVPVKLIWSREDDMQHDFYRPSTLHRVRGVINQAGDIEAWRHRLVSASIIKGMAVTIVGGYMPSWLPESMARGIGRIASNTAANNDSSMAEGAVIPYAVANKKVDVALYDPGIPLGFWRSVGHSHNAFVAESFMDEMAHAAQQDPLAYRLKYLTDHPRHVGVLNAVAKAANWGYPVAGRIQGIAVHESFSSYVAEVVEISKTSNGYKIERVVCAVDCGRVLNPSIVVEQVESAVNYGLSGALKAAVKIADGRVVQSNFHDLPVLRMNEAPHIEVVLVASDAHPTGVGEIALPPLAPALANALFSASGKRQRDLPLSLSVS